MLARGLSAVASVLAVLLACSPDEATSPISSEILDTVSVRGGLGISSHPPSTIRVSLSIRGVGLDSMTTARYALFDQASIHDGDEGTILVAKPDNDSDFLNLAALLTNGIDDPITFDMVTDGGGAGSTSPESMFFGKTPGSPDFDGYVIDSIQFLIDSVLIATPGTNPNGDGIWTDYDIRGQVVVFGHRQ